MGCIKQYISGVTITDNEWKKKYRAGGNGSEPYKGGNDNLGS